MFPQWLQNLTNDPSAMTLIVGGGVMLVTFLAMQWSKWGQANPVSQCVILSVLAHIVLLVYAYRWNLVTEVPTWAIPEAVPIRVATESTTAIREPELESQEKPIWEQILAAELSPAETLAAADAPPVETELVVERQDDSPADRTAAQDSWLDATAEWMRSAVPAPSDGVSELASSPWLEPLLQPTKPESETVPSNLWEGAPTAQELPTPAEAQRTGLAHNPGEGADGQAGAETQAVDLTQSAQLLQETLDQLGLERPLSTDDAVIDQWVAGEVSSQTARAEAAPPGQSATEIADRLEQLQGQASEWNLMDPQRVPEIFAPPRPDLPWAEPQRLSAQAARAAQATRRASLWRAADQKPLPDVYQRRMHRDLAEIQLRGGSPETEQAVARGLAFLAAIQKPDGSWNPRETGAGREQQIMGHNRQGAGAQADTGITALGLLAFLADGNTHLGGAYQETVRRGLEFLLQRQQRGGSLAGPAQYYAQTYCHSMALLALSEAYALTGDDRLRAAVEAGVAYSVDTQNRAGGGWRYQPQEAGDMSQFGWQVMALGSAGLNGVGIDEAARRLMLQFLQRHSRGTHGGLAVYRVGEGITPTMTAEALFCRYLLGQRPSRAQVEEACGEILGLGAGGGPAEQGVPLTIRDARYLPGKQVDNLYFWYYGSLALQQAAVDPNLVDSPLIAQSWELWNRHLSTRLMSLQRTDGPWAGSWDPEACLWGGYGGRVYTTSLAVLCLQVYYRYDLDGDGASRTAQVPWSPTPMGPTPPLGRGPATGSLHDWR